MNLKNKIKFIQLKNNLKVKLDGIWLEYTYPKLNKEIYTFDFIVGFQDLSKILNLSDQSVAKHFKEKKNWVDSKGVWVPELLKNKYVFTGGFYSDEIIDGTKKTVGGEYMLQFMKPLNKSNVRNSDGNIIITTITSDELDRYLGINTSRGFLIL